MNISSIEGPYRGNKGTVSIPKLDNGWFGRHFTLVESEDFFKHK